MNKKLYTLLFSLMLVFSQSLSAMAYKIDAAAPKEQVVQEEGLIQTVSDGNDDSFTIDAKLSKDIKTSINKIYGSDNADEIYHNVIKHAQKAYHERSKQLKNEDVERPSEWYKDEIIYMFYVDQFGVVSPEKPSDFKNTTQMLDYLKDLGVTTLYLLPFADSPMGDSGFDVKNPQNVRQDLGGMPQFKDFIAAARVKGFKIKADLVLNHFSDQHEWFKEALNGDIDKINYFVVKDEMPSYTKYNDEQKGVIVEYKEKDGKISKRRLIFPEIAENHYRKVTINGKDYYFYHSFYPFQLDINWENPNVLYYCLDTISTWANLGVDIFRMDAIPYLIKEDGTDAENLPKTHQIIKLLSSYLQATAPRSVIQAEACQVPKDILPYFGTERKIKVSNDDFESEIKRTDEVQIAYHFPYMPALWASILTEDYKYFKEANKQTPSIPSSSAWAIFLRVHDELTLEMIEPEVRKMLYSKLAPKGAPFREGLGVSGRMSNFLDNNPDRIEMAFAILLSMPGIPVIYYGDEIGIHNNFEYAKKYAAIRKAHQIKNKLNLLTYFDSRDINRGYVDAKLFYGSSKNYYAYNSAIYRRVKKLIKIRKTIPAMGRGTFALINTKQSNIFAYVRTYNNQKILIINNLSKEKLDAEIELPLDIVLKAAKNEGHVHLKNLMNISEEKVKLILPNRKLLIPMRGYESIWLQL